MQNMPKVKIGVVAVSRDCFPESLSVNRRKALIAAYQKQFGDVDVFFGPAYKGIPLAVAAAIAYFELYGKEVKYCCDRKEAKDHGEGGMFVGKTLTDNEKVVIIDDVMTSGKALRESMPKLKSAADVNVTGMVITVDRMELSAVQEVKRDFGVTVYPIVTMEDIIEAIKNDIVPGKEYLL